LGGGRSSEASIVLLSFSFASLLVHDLMHDLQPPAQPVGRSVYGQNLRVVQETVEDRHGQNLLAEAQREERSAQAVAITANGRLLRRLEGTPCEDLAAHR
jgi:hypothetical protein